MAKISKNLITLPKPLLRKEGIVVLPLEKYEKLKEELEMVQSNKLAKDIEKARKEKRTVPLERLLKEHNL